MNKMTNMLPKNHIVQIALGTGLILLVPLIAMQFTSVVKWGIVDFVIIGMLLFGTGLIYELLAGTLQKKEHRVIAGMVLIAALLYIWAELAVGIFTNLGS